jgi:hypothetical protein
MLCVFVFGGVFVDYCCAHHIEHARSRKVSIIVRRRNEKTMSSVFIQNSKKMFYKILTTVFGW